MIWFIICVWNEIEKLTATLITYVDHFSDSIWSACQQEIFLSACCMPMVVDVFFMISIAHQSKRNRSFHTHSLDRLLFFPFSKLLWFLCGVQLCSYLNHDVVLNDFSPIVDFRLLWFIFGSCCYFYFWQTQFK